MFNHPVPTARPVRTARAEKWYRRLTVLLLGGLIAAFVLVPLILIAAPDNATKAGPDTQPDNTTIRHVNSGTAQVQSDKFKWKFIICFPMPVDVLPARAAERNRLGGAGLVSTLGSLSVNDLFIAH